MAKNEIYSQLRLLKPDASFTDAKLFYIYGGRHNHSAFKLGWGKRAGESVFEYFYEGYNYMQMKILGLRQ